MEIKEFKTDSRGESRARFGHRLYVYKPYSEIEYSCVADVRRSAWIARSDREWR